MFIICFLRFTLILFVVWRRKSVQLEKDLFPIAIKLDTNNVNKLMAITMDVDKNNNHNKTHLDCFLASVFSQFISVPAFFSFFFLFFDFVFYNVFYSTPPPPPTTFFTHIAEHSLLAGWIRWRNEIVSWERKGWIEIGTELNWTEVESRQRKSLFSQFTNYQRSISIKIINNISSILLNGWIDGCVEKYKQKREIYWMEEEHHYKRTFYQAESIFYSLELLECILIFPLPLNSWRPPTQLPDQPFPKYFQFTFQNTLIDNNYDCPLLLLLKTKLNSRNYLI